MIRQLSKEEPLPFNLLLLADPEEEAIFKYAYRSDCYVLEKQNTCIGVYMLLATRPGTAEIMNLAVCEEHQGKGHGKELIRHAIETARERGFQLIEIGTGNSSVQQLLLYQKEGFRISGVEADYFVRNYKDPILENGIACKDMIRLQQYL